MITNDSKEQPPEKNCYTILTQNNHLNINESWKTQHNSFIEFNFIIFYLQLQTPQESFHYPTAKTTNSTIQDYF